jgi:hypothetical protein
MKPSALACSANLLICSKVMFSWLYLILSAMVP